MLADINLAGISLNKGFSGVFQMENRRQFIWRVAELASLVPVGFLGVNSAAHQDSFAKASPHKLLETEAGKCAESVRLLNEAISPWADSMMRLKSQYRSSYHHSHTYYTRDSKGHRHSHTYYTWDEPNFVPSHSVIESWVGSASSLDESVKSIIANPLFDLTDERNVEVSRESPHFKTKLALTALVYVPSAALLIGYEEALQNMDIISDSSKGMERRNVLKLAAAAIAAIPAYNFQNAHVEESVQSVQRMKDQVSAVVGEFNRIPAEVAFEKAVGLSRPALYQILSDVESSSTQMARYDGSQGVLDDAVRVAFTDVAAKSVIARSKVGELLACGGNAALPKEIECSVRSHLAFTRINDLNGGEERSAYTNPVLECAYVAGIMALILGLYELGLQRSSPQ